MRRALMRPLAANLTLQGHVSLLLWVMEGDRTCAFYQSVDGKAHLSKVEAVSGGELREVNYAWADMEVTRAQAAKC